ncbi:MAG: ankyrin repeat domain-containing protein [Janthinobacterium lividum]
MKRYLSFWLLLLLCLPMSAITADPLTPAVAALLTAARQGDNAKIQTLIKQGVDVNATVVNLNYNALMIAAQMNHPATVKLLLDHGASANLSVLGSTPLLLASAGFVNILAGALPPNPQKETSAWQHGYYDIIRLLIDRGADVKMSDIQGGTALLYAAYGCDAKTLQLLLRHGADVNARTSDGNTILMRAGSPPWPDRVTKVKLLLAWGADINAKNAKGDTALILAKQAHQADVVKVLEAELAKRKKTEPAVSAAAALPLLQGARDVLDRAHQASNLAELNGDLTNESAASMGFSLAMMAEAMNSSFSLNETPEEASASAKAVQANAASLINRYSLTEKTIRDLNESGTLPPGSSVQGHELLTEALALCDTYEKTHSPDKDGSLSTQFGKNVFPASRDCDFEVLSLTRVRITPRRASISPIEARLEAGQWHLDIGNKWPKQLQL